MIDIVLAVDSKSVGYTKALINSIRSNVNDPIIHLLTDSEIQHRDWFDNIVIVPSNLVNIDGPYKRITNHTYYRLFIDKLLPNIKKCVYLDWDVIVLKDISELLEGDDWIIKGVSINDNSYLNAGVIAFNFTEEAKICMSIARSRIGYSPDDQDCLNKGFEGKTTSISYDYNCMIGCIEPSNSTKIIHYLGPQKPWHSHPSIKYWFKYGNIKW